MSNIQKRIIILGLSIITLVVTTWLELFVQKEHCLIGGGINRTFLFLLINIHIIVIICLVYIIFRHSIKLFHERRKGVPGSVFKRNLLISFLFLSVLPSIFIFFTTGKFVAKSMDRWFKSHIGLGFDNAFSLHEAHTSHARSELRKAGSSMLKGEPISNTYDRYMFLEKKLQDSDLIYNEIAVWRCLRETNDRTMKSLKNQFINIFVRYDQHLFDFYGSLYWFKKQDGRVYVLIYRYPQAVASSLMRLQSSRVDYEQLKAMRIPVQLSYFFTFILVCLLILFLSIWCAFFLARGIARPIQELLDATDKVSHGQWDVLVSVNPSSDLQSLAQKFNDMTKAMRQARGQLELRNREMRAILQHLTASVFFINKFGRITFFNQAAKKFVAKHLDVKDLTGKKVSIFGREIYSRCYPIIQDLVKKHQGQLVKELSITCDGQPRSVIIYFGLLSIDRSVNQSEQGMLVVVDDVTDLVKGNTIKTWQEAAKQMAHEIKNPLTPIQLATQRLQRKFKETLQHEPSFYQSTETILSQVKVIKDLVSHFSEFASMPSIQLSQVDVSSIIRELCCFYQVSFPSIDFLYDLPEQDIDITTDKEKLKRAFINLMDNSARALLAHNRQDDRDKPTISIIVKIQESKLKIIFQDNGPGIKQSVQDTLFLPHVSTEKKNMGLGLAIVHDTIVQLGGSITLLQSNRGAYFLILFPYD